MPPKEWMYSENIKDLTNRSIEDYLQGYYLPIPHHWKNNDMTVFDRACFGEIPNI